MEVKLFHPVTLLSPRWILLLHGPRRSVAGVCVWGAGQRFSDSLVPCKMFLILVRVLSVFFIFSCLGKITEGPNVLAISRSIRR